MEQPKNFWALNVKFLRNRRKLSQDSLASRLNISRSKLNAHENGQTQNPTLEDLLRFSEYFQISIDALLKTDLAGLPAFKLRELEAGNDIYITGSKIRVLAISTDPQNRENLEYVPIRAKAGYRSGYNDPEYIAALPKFSLPGLPKHGTFRMFPTSGDSMLPIPEGSNIIGRYIEDWKSLKPDTPCIMILSGDQDFVFKLVTFLPEKEAFLLRSGNALYAPYTVPANEVLEIWKYHSHQTTSFPQPEPTLQQVMELIRELKTELLPLKKRNAAG